MWLIILGGLIKCSTCGQQSQTADIIDNMFVPTALKPSSADATPVDDEVRICTGCEENTSATFFCVECVEWLCDQCTQAHKRVKVTKDHTIEAKENVSGHGDGKKDNNKSQVLFCPCHPQEQLKLYCNTCGKLTCRDCQLVEHKDHKYQFLQEAALSYKDFLQSLLVKIKEKQTYIDNAKSLIDKRNKEIIQKEQNVINEVKIFAMSLITEINLKCRQLVGDLQSICTAKKRQLQQKESEIKLLSENLEHSLQFAEHLLRLGDETGLLYSRRTLAGQLRTILQTRCEVPNPYHVVDLRFTSNSAIGPVISKLGYIIVDGITFNRRPSQVPGPGGTVPQGVAGVSSSSPSGGYISPMAQLPVGSVTPQPVATQVMSAEQKQALLTSMRKSYERSREERRLQQHQIMQRQQMQQQHGSHGAVYMGQSRTDSVPGYSTQRLSHLPNQSANISSTIVSGQQLKMASASGTFYPSSISLQNGGYTTSLSPPGYSTHGGGQISLAQLQEDRMRRQSAHHSSNSSMRPIVIEPTPYEPPSPLPSYTGLWIKLIKLLNIEILYGWYLIQGLCFNCSKLWIRGARHHGIQCIHYITYILHSRCQNRLFYQQLWKFRHQTYCAVAFATTYLVSLQLLLEMYWILPDIWLNQKYNQVSSIRLDLVLTGRISHSVWSRTNTTILF